MSNAAWRSAVLLALMLSTAGLAQALKPRIYLADELPPLTLAQVVPATMGDWRELPETPVMVVDPGRQAVIDRIYSQTLTRTYVNPQGYRIMLSIAYGRDQSDGFSVHVPEVCYPAQGFSVLEKHKTALDAGARSLSITRLSTRRDLRWEPVTYWTLTGSIQYRGGIEKKLAEIRYGMHGRIPDGMLVRVSSIDAQPDRAYALQAAFARTLLSALPALLQNRFGGEAEIVSGN